MITEPNAEHLVALVDKLRATDTAVNIDYMSQALAEIINTTTANMALKHFQILMQNGYSQEAAEFVVNHVRGPVAFQIGLLVGQEVEATRAFEEQFGGGSE